MVRVAIVDDDRSHCVALARLLRASGMEIESFNSAEEYLERAREPGIDCLVLDIQLGGMSGFELHDRLAAAGGPPVVFLSAHDEPDTLERARRTGCPYLRKTEPGQAVIDAIQRSVRSRSPLPREQ